MNSPSRRAFNSARLSTDSFTETLSLLAPIDEVAASPNCGERRYRISRLPTRLLMALPIHSANHDFRLELLATFVDIIGVGVEEP
jgi:hypothetical protein